MKKALVLTLALVISLFAAIELTACNDVEFEVKFVVDGTVYDTITTAGNESIKIPENPTKEGYTFDGWYLDEGVWEKPFTANSLLDAPLSSDMNVYAHWLTVTEPAPDQGTQGGDNNGGTTTPDDNSQVGNNGGTATPDTHVHSLTHTERVEAGCTTDGNIEYWHCSGCGKNYSDANAENEVSSVVIPSAHALTHHARVETGCTTDGNIEYWHCSGCGKNYSDANAENEVSSVAIPAGHALTHYARIEAGCTSDGNIEYWHCSGCGKNYSDANAKTEVSSVVITPAGHSASASSTVCTRCGLVSFGGLGFTLQSNNTYAVTNYTGSATSVVIPTTYENALVTSIGEGAFSGCSSLTSINIPSSVTSIGEDAFSDCSSLEEITIPNGVTSIGNMAFLNCTGLTEINFNATAMNTAMNNLSPLNYVFSYAGQSGSGIKVTIGKNVTKIPAYLFCPNYNNSSYAPKITSVEFEEGSVCTSIGSYAFRYCSSLTSITIPNSVTSIGWYAFEGCSSLTSITIPNSVTSIGDYAFLDCSSLTSINIPNSVTSIADYAFSGCTSLKSITIPNSVTSIGSWAFYGCSSLTSITIPNSVTSIGSSAFYGCSKLTSINIPNSVTSIVAAAFYNCSSLKSITIPNSVTSIGKSAFYNCSSLEEITIPSSVTSIGEGAFYYCSSLTSITIPNSVTSIGNYAFYNCTALTEINFNATAMNDLSSWNYVFSYAGQSGSGIKVTIGKNVTKIPAYLFYPYSRSSYAPKITSVEFEDGSICTSIGWYAFEGCSSLDEVYISDIAKWCTISFGSGDANTMYYANKLYMVGSDTPITNLIIPEGVTTIPTYAFSSNAITSVTIPSSVTSIGYGAFEYCSSLDKVYISDIARWCAISFGNASANPLYYAKKLYTVASDTPITNLIIPEGVTTIPTCAFSSDAITSVTIPSSVTSIGSEAFRDCSSLTSVTIGSGVTSIGYDAFYNCTSLTEIKFNATAMNNLSSKSDAFTSVGRSGSGIKVTIGKNVTKIPAYLFCPNYNNSSYAPKITSVEFEEGSVCTSIGNYAFEYCSSLEEITIPNSVTSIGEDAFEYCTSLTSITIPNSVTSIGDYAFRYCSSLTSITIPNGVTSIGERAFYGCTSLTSITIPNSVTSIGERAFYGCYKLVEVYNLSNLNITKGNEDYGYVGYYALDIYTSATATSKLHTTSDGYIFYEDGDTVYLVGYTGNSATLTLPDNYNGKNYAIYKYAFYEDDNITSVIIGSGVTSIGNYAFAYCSSLTSVTFENTSGWWRSLSSTATSGTSISSSGLADTSTAATYLKSTYCYYDWKRG